MFATIRMTSQPDPMMIRKDAKHKYHFTVHLIEDQYTTDAMVGYYGEEFRGRFEISGTATADDATEAQQRIEAAFGVNNISSMVYVKAS